MSTTLPKRGRSGHLPSRLTQAHRVLARRLIRRGVTAPHRPSLPVGPGSCCTRNAVPGMPYRGRSTDLAPEAGGYEPEHLVAGLQGGGWTYIGLRVATTKTCRARIPRIYSFIYTPVDLLLVHLRYCFYRLTRHHVVQRYLEVLPPEHGQSGQVVLRNARKARTMALVLLLLRR